MPDDRTIPRDPRDEFHRRARNRPERHTPLQQVADGKPVHRRERR